MSDFESDVSSTANETPHLLGGVLTRSQTASGADSEEETTRTRQRHARDRSSTFPTAASTPNTLVCGTPAQLPRDAEGVESGGATPATTRRVAPEPDQKVAESARRRIISESQRPESGDSHGGQDTDEQEIYSLEDDPDRAATEGAGTVQPPALVFTGMPRHGAGGDQVRPGANSRDVEMPHPSTDTLPSGHDRAKAEERPALTHSATALPRHVTAAQNPVTKHHAAGIPSGSAHEQPSNGPRAERSHDPGPAIDFCNRWPVNRRVLLEALRELHAEESVSGVPPRANTRVLATTEVPRSHRAESTEVPRVHRADSTEKPEFTHGAQAVPFYRYTSRARGSPRVETYTDRARDIARRAGRSELMSAQTRAILNYEDDTVMLRGPPRRTAPVPATRRYTSNWGPTSRLTEEQCNSEPGSVARLLADLAKVHAEEQPGNLTSSSSGSTPQPRTVKATELTRADIQETVQAAVMVAVSASFDKKQQDQQGLRSARQLALAAIGRSSPPRNHSKTVLTRKHASANNDEPPPLVGGEESSDDSDPEFTDFLDARELQRYGMSRSERPACLRLLTEQRKRSKADFQASGSSHAAFIDYLTRQEIQQEGIHPANIEACFALLNAQRQRSNRMLGTLTKKPSAVRDLSFQGHDDFCQNAGLDKLHNARPVVHERGDAGVTRCRQHAHSSAARGQCADLTCTPCQQHSVARSYYSDGPAPSRRPSVEWANGEGSENIVRARRYNPGHPHAGEKQSRSQTQELDASDIGLLYEAGRPSREPSTTSAAMTRKPSRSPSRGLHGMRTYDRSSSRRRTVSDVKLPSFNGNNWLAFYQQFASACDANDYSSQERGHRLRCALTGTAMNLLTNHGSEDWTYQQLVDALEARHGRTKAPSDVENQLNDMRKKPAQSALEFADALDSLASKAKMTVADAAAATYHAFKNGLRDFPSMHKYVLTKDKEKTLRSAANLAAEWERSIGSDAATVDTWAMLEAHRASQNEALATLNAFNQPRTEPPKAPRPPQGIPQGSCPAPAQTGLALAKILENIETKLAVVYDDAERRKAYIEKKQQARNKKRKEFSQNDGPPQDNRQRPDQRDQRDRRDQRPRDNRQHPDQRPPQQNGQAPNQDQWARQDNRPQNQDAWPRQDARPPPQNPDAWPRPDARPQTQNA